jgi:hypothetical protein
MENNDFNINNFKATLKNFIETRQGLNCEPEKSLLKSIEILEVTNDQPI